MRTTVSKKVSSKDGGMMTRVFFPGRFWHCSANISTPLETEPNGGCVNQALSLALRYKHTQPGDAGQREIVYMPSAFLVPSRV